MRAACAAYMRRWRAAPAREPVWLPYRYASFAVGIGGDADALGAARPALERAGLAVESECVFACDILPERVAACNAAAAARGGDRAAVVADVTDAAFFTRARIASWGDVDAVLSCIVCRTVSYVGRRAGLGDPECEKYIMGLFRIVRLLAPAQLFLE
jgi:site-specific DNA-cytosine methylase